LPPDGPVLGFDCAGGGCAAAIVHGGRVIAFREEEMSRGQAERLMPMIEGLLAGAATGWRDLRAIGVGTGPGNFTGLRIAVAAARGLALSLGVPAMGVSAFRALAHGLPRPVLIGVSAPGGQIHVALVSESGESAPALADPSAPPSPPARRGVLCVGDGAGRLAEALAGRVAQPLHPVAGAVALIAAAEAAPGLPRPAPVYVRAAAAAPPVDPPPAILT